MFCTWMSCSSHVQRNRRDRIQSHVVLLWSLLVSYALWPFCSLLEACDIFVSYGLKFVLQVSHLEVMGDM